jgi:hypothetical protein
MGNFNPGDNSAVVATAQAMGSSRNHDIDVSVYDKVSVQIVWAGADKNDSFIQIHASTDGTNFDSDAMLLSKTMLAAAAGNHNLMIEVQSLSKIRVAFDHGTVAAGTYVLSTRSEVPN